MHYFLYDEILTEARSWKIKAYEDFIKQCSVFFVLIGWCVKADRC